MISITEQIILTSLFLIVVSSVTLKQVELEKLEQWCTFFVLKVSIWALTIFGIVWIWGL
jgi:hypothetical protein